MRIRRWIKQYNAEAALHFDEYRVLFRSAKKKPYFLAMLSAAGEDGNGAAFDSVEPCGIHTTASDASKVGLPVLTYQADQGMQARVAWELATELGTEEQCVAKSRSDFEEHAVQFALNRRQARARQTDN